jgi:cytochrome bd-type quinol oxidase subunit 1
MYVRKNGNRYVLLTPTAKSAKERALRALSTANGSRLAAMIYSKKMDTATARSYAGKHYRSFLNGSKLTGSEYERVQSALGAATAVAASNLKTYAIIGAFQETQDAAEQANSISDQANQRIVDLEKELEAWKKAFAEAQAAAVGGTSGEDVAVLLAQVTTLTEQLEEAKRVAAEANADAVEAEAEAADAEEQYNEVVPWYLRYKWQIGVGALVVAIAGGAYWLTSRRPLEKNTRLPVPTSPKHPAGF